MERIENPEILAYLAGLVDGEGSIQMLRRISKPSYKVYYTLKLSVSGTKEPLEEWLVENIGGHIARSKGKGNRSDSFQWWMSDREAQDILEQIRPYSVLKQAHIDQALRANFNPIKNTYSIDEELRRREMFQILCELNKRGVHHG